MFYWPTIYLLRFLFKIFTRFECKGRECIPKRGSFLLVGNHISHFDPPVYSAGCTRSIDWMGSDVLFKSRLASFYFRNSNVIKVRQYEADQVALREAVRRLKAGRRVGLFPEGGIRAGKVSLLGDDYKLYDGAFMIATLAQVPIVPCLVVGSDRLYNPQSLKKHVPIWVRFGDPIPVNGKGREEIARLRTETEKAIRKMAEELRATGKLIDDDWPRTPQERNPRIAPPARQLD